MEAKNVLSAEILGQIALIQGMVSHLPDKENIMRFVCRGLAEIPGVDNIDYVIYQDYVAPTQTSVQEADSLLKIAIKLEGIHHGELLFSISDVDLFDPYIPFVENMGVPDMPV